MDFILIVIVTVFYNLIYLNVFYRETFLWIKNIFLFWLHSKLNITENVKLHKNFPTISSCDYTFSNKKKLKSSFNFLCLESDLGFLTKKCKLFLQKNEDTEIAEEMVNISDKYNKILKEYDSLILNLQDKKRELMTHLENDKPGFYNSLDYKIQLAIAEKKSIVSEKLNKIDDLYIYSNSDDLWNDFLLKLSIILNSSEDSAHSNQLILNLRNNFPFYFKIGESSVEWLLSKEKHEFKIGELELCFKLNILKTNPEIVELLFDAKVKSENNFDNFSIFTRKVDIPQMVTNLRKMEYYSSPLISDSISEGGDLYILHCHGLRETICKLLKEPNVLKFKLIDKDAIIMTNKVNGDFFIGVIFGIFNFPIQYFIGLIGDIFLKSFFVALFTFLQLLTAAFLYYFFGEDIVCKKISELILTSHQKNVLRVKEYKNICCDWISNSISKICKDTNLIFFMGQGTETPNEYEIVTWMTSEVFVLGESIFIINDNIIKLFVKEVPNGFYSVDLTWSVSGFDFENVKSIIFPKDKLSRVCLFKDLLNRVCSEGCKISNSHSRFMGKRFLHMLNPLELIDFCYTYDETSYILSKGLKDNNVYFGDTLVNLNCDLKSKFVLNTSLNKKSICLLTIYSALFFNLYSDGVICINKNNNLLDYFIFDFLSGKYPQNGKLGFTNKVYKVFVCDISRIFVISGLKPLMGITSVKPSRTFEIVKLFKDEIFHLNFLKDVLNFEIITESHLRVGLSYEDSLRFQFKSNEKIIELANVLKETSLMETEDRVKLKESNKDKVSDLFEIAVSNGLDGEKLDCIEDRLMDLVEECSRKSINKNFDVLVKRSEFIESKQVTMKVIEANIKTSFNFLKNQKKLESGCFLESAIKKPKNSGECLSLSDKIIQRDMKIKDIEKLNNKFDVKTKLFENNKGQKSLYNAIIKIKNEIIDSNAQLKKLEEAIEKAMASGVNEEEGKGKDIVDEFEIPKKVEEELGFFKHSLNDYKKQYKKLLLDLNENLSLGLITFNQHGLIKNLITNNDHFIITKDQKDEEAISIILKETEGMLDYIVFVGDTKIINFKETLQRIKNEISFKVLQKELNYSTRSENSTFQDVDVLSDFVKFCMTEVGNDGYSEFSKIVLDNCNNCNGEIVGEGSVARFGIRNKQKGNRSKKRRKNKMKSKFNGEFSRNRRVNVKNLSLFKKPINPDNFMSAFIDSITLGYSKLKLSQKVDSKCLNKTKLKSIVHLYRKKFMCYLEKTIKRCMDELQTIDFNKLLKENVNTLYIKIFISKLLCSCI